MVDPANENQLPGQPSGAEQDIPVIHTASQVHPPVGGAAGQSSHVQALAKHQTHPSQVTSHSGPAVANTAAQQPVLSHAPVSLPSQVPTQAPVMDSATSASRRSYTCHTRPATIQHTCGPCSSRARCGTDHG